MNIYYVYRITNLINGKAYIGKTKTLHKRFYQHINRGGTSLIFRAIKKYGVENFIFETLYQCDDDKEITNKEYELIHKYNTLHPNGYNLTDKTDGNIIFSERHKNKLSKKRQGIGQTERKSPYIGVIKNECGTYTSTVRINHKCKAKNYKSEIEAAEAYDKMSLFIYGKNARINFEEKRAEFLLSDLKKFYDEYMVGCRGSIYKEIYKTRVDGKLKFGIKIHNIKKIPIKLRLRTYDSEIEAAETRDKIVLYYKLSEKFNFPEKVEQYKIGLEKFIINIPKMHSRGGLGISKTKYNSWRVTINKDGKPNYLGTFKTKKEAIMKREVFVKNQYSP